MEYRLWNFLIREIEVRNGQSLNSSAIGRRIGLSNHAVKDRLDLLERAGTIRVLPSLAGHRPQVLLRDSLLLRVALTERVAAIMGPARLFCWQATRKKQLDLVVAMPQARTGFLFLEDQVRNKHRAVMRLAFEQGIINRGFIIHDESRAYVTARACLALPVGMFLDRIGRWLACRSFREARDLLREIASSERLPS